MPAKHERLWTSFNLENEGYRTCFLGDENMELEFTTTSWTPAGKVERQTALMMLHGLQLRMAEMPCWILRRLRGGTPQPWAAFAWVCALLPAPSRSSKAGRFKSLPCKNMLPRLAKTNSLSFLFRFQDARACGEELGHKALFKALLGETIFPRYMISLPGLARKHSDVRIVQPRCRQLPRHFGFTISETRWISHVHFGFYMQINSRARKDSLQMSIRRSYFAEHFGVRW